VGAVSVTVSRPAALALSPVLVRQALRVRQRTPRLPEAAGEQRGIEFTANATHLLRLLVVGESTAAGVGVTELREALPRQLAVMLAARGQCNVAWSMSARTGATASFAAEKLAPVAPMGQDIAVVMVGVNDALKFTPRRVWRAHIDQLIDELAKHMRPGGQVALAGLPDLGRFGTFPQPLRALLGWHARALNRDLKTIAGRGAGLIYLAMPPVSWPELFAADRFHPSAAAYRVLAACFADALATTKPKREGGGVRPGRPQPIWQSFRRNSHSER
jgi:lysophospholipase L1-like esterase